MEGPSQQVKTEASTTKLQDEKIEDFERARGTLNRVDELTLGYPREKNHEFLFRTQPPDATSFPPAKNLSGTRMSGRVEESAH
jgi:hypothetical protein